MSTYSELIERELAATPVSEQAKTLPRLRRWFRKAVSVSTATTEAASEVSSLESPPLSESVPPPPAPVGERKQRPSKFPSYILQHYDATGCAGGAFSWRAAMMNPEKSLFMCTEPREYRDTTWGDIRLSKEDKRRGGGPRVGPFQACIPGCGWQALPKYDFTTRNRSSAFNERMHVEWENHVDHILGNGGELPVASVVAKAGFRSCAPCCRDMLALARPTGKTFIMVDLAEDDKRGTFHFVAGDKYLPVPKEACTQGEVAALKGIVADAQDQLFTSSEAIYDAVMQLGPPIDETAQGLYLGDRALLPKSCGIKLEGNALLKVIHAEHFARLSAEYGASILRDATRPQDQREAIIQCRSRAKKMLAAAWRPYVVDIDLDAYAAAATAPLLPEEPRKYLKLKSAARRGLRPAAPRLTADTLHAIDEDAAASAPTTMLGGLGLVCKGTKSTSDSASTAGSTALPDDGASTLTGDIDYEDPENEQL